MKFRKRPIVVEAVQFFASARPWPDGVFDGCCWTPVYGGREKAHQGPHVATLEGLHCVSEGDWIITGVKGEKYPCKPDIFEATYEPVSPEPGRES